MNKEASTNHSNKSSEISKVGLCLNLVVGYLAPAVILFGSAGRLDLPMFWAYVMLLWGLGLVGFVVIIKKHPDLIKERLHPGSGTKESLRFLKAINIATWVGHLLVAGLDVGRFHWSGEITLRIRIVGLAVFAGAMGIAQWSGAANRFASSVVRLQLDRGHYVVTTGPYRYVRHPMYVGCILMGPFGAVGLGSWWAILATLPAIVLVIRRTVSEDRFLQKELEGYAEYAARVRYRLVPGVW
ncbi:hypothetical protein ES703_89444 [subsurface metagenome]